MAKAKGRNTIPVHVDREFHKAATAFAQRMGITIGEALVHLGNVGLRRLAALSKHSDSKKGERKGLTHRPTERKDRAELMKKRETRLKERAGGKRRPPKSKVDERDGIAAKPGSDASLADAELE